MRKKLKAVGAALVAALIGSGIMPMLPDISESTAGMTGVAVTVAGWKTVVGQDAKA